jgi:hypothetical protein
MVRQIVIEAETPGDSRTKFRLRIDASAIADGLTAVQAHVLVGEILERIAAPNSPGDPETAPAPDLAPTPRRSTAGRGLMRLMSQRLGLVWHRKERPTVNTAPDDIGTV